MFSIFILSAHLLSVAGALICESFHFVLVRASRAQGNDDFVDEAEEIFRCPNSCGKKYKHKCSLSKHLKYECGSLKLFKCHMCQRRFAQKNHLKTHLGLIHKVVGE